MLTFLHQFRIQLQRDRAIFAVDRVNMLLATVQAPLIALLMVLTFYGNSQDCHQSNLAARTLYYYSQKTAGQRSISLEDLAVYGREAYAQAQKSSDNARIFSENMAQNRTMIYFVLVAASIWMGILGSCKEIVSEWEVIHRESHSGFLSSSYAFAKIALFCGIAGLQTFLLTYLSLPFLVPGSLAYAWQIWLILWLTASCAVLLGLLVSCFSTSLQIALTCVPILMIPQLLLGGFLRPPARSIESPLRDTVAAFTIQRWALESCIAVENHRQEFLFQPQKKFSGHQVVEFYLKDRHIAAEQEELKEDLKLAWQIISSRTRSLDDYFFKIDPEFPGEAVEFHLYRPIGVLLLFLLALCGGVCISLRLRIALANSGRRGF